MHLISVISIFILNTIFSLAFIIVFGVMKKRFDNLLIGIIMLFCPVAGALYFLFSYLMYKYDSGKKVISEADVSFSKEKVNNVLFPDYDSDIQIVPLEETFLVSNNEDKRKALLTKLKKDIDSSLGTISKALENEDAETSHYAASAIMNATNTYMTNLKEYEKIYEKDRTDYEVNRKFFEYLLNYMQSGIFDEIKRKRYTYQLVALITNMLEQHDGMVTHADFSKIVDCIIAIEDFRLAEEWARRAMTRADAGEKNYLDLLKVFYLTGQDALFFKTLSDLRASDISLSNAGLEFIRFFTKGGRVSV